MPRTHIICRPTHVLFLSLSAPNTHYLSLSAPHPCCFRHSVPRHPFLFASALASSVPPPHCSVASAWGVNVPQRGTAALRVGVLADLDRGLGLAWPTRALCEARRGGSLLRQEAEPKPRRARRRAAQTRGARPGRGPRGGASWGRR